MSVEAAAVLTLLVFAWSVTSGELARRNVTGPLVFAVAGYVLSNPTWGPVGIDVDASSIHLIAEVTLALLLFTDAARVNLRDLRSDSALPVRLLGIGLPLSVAAGAVAAGVVLDIPWGLALFLGATLAPTDAALSVRVINDERIPMRLRRSLNVESGLNDGIVTPVVSVALAVAASQLGHVDETVSIEFGFALRELGIGAVTGAAAGGLGALALNLTSQSGWIAPGGRRLAALALAVGAMAATLALDGNGFIAAFVAGVAFGALADHDEIDIERTAELPELGGELLGLVVWFLFGATLIPIAFEHLGGAVVVYALLSLTVAASILLHGLTAGPGGRRYVQLENADPATGPRARQSLLTRDHPDTRPPVSPHPSTD